MNSPALANTQWLNDAVAVLLLAVSAYSLVELAGAIRRRTRDDADINVSHLLMGVAMAGMLNASWNFVSNPVGEIVFGVLALWFAALIVLSRTGRGGHARHVLHYPVHLVMAGAMVYMYWLAGSTGTGGSMMSMTPTNGDPLFTFLFTIALFVSAAVTLNATSRTVVGVERSGNVLALTERVSHVLMCLGMAYMLILML